MARPEVPDTSALLEAVRRPERWPACLLYSYRLVRYLGEESGFMGLILAMLAGSVAPGGSLIQFPIIASLQRSGAGAGPLAAYLTAWSLMPVQRTLVWELPFLGLPFVAARLLVSAAAPLLAGLCVPIILKLITH